MIFPHDIVHVQPVVYPPLDPLGAILYVALFAGVTLLTMRRPVYGVCVLIAVQPFALYQDVFSTTLTLSKVSLLAVLLGLAAYRNAFAPVASGVPWRVLCAGLFVLAATLLSYAHAAHHAPVIREALKAAEYVLLFIAVVSGYRLDPDRRALRTIVFVTTIAVSIAALVQEIVGAPSGLWVNGHVIPRIAGPLEGPNQLAGYFDIALPLVLALAMDEPAALATAALFLATCADFLTFSRAGNLAAAIAIVIVAVLLRRNVRRSIGAIVAGLLVGIGADAAWTWAAHSGAGAAFRFAGNEGEYAGGVGTRRELWHAAIVLWKQHPLFGIGAGNFEVEIPLTGLQGVRTHANSLYLQSLVEGGIPLIAATLWLVYASIANFIPDRLRSPLVTAALAGSIALALHQTVDFITFYPKAGGMWWIALALGAAEIAAIARVKTAACA